MSRVPQSPAGLDELLRRRDLWRMRGDVPTGSTGIPTGFAALDRALPGRGWPTFGLVEVRCPEPGSAALPLLLPAFSRLSGLGAWLGLVAPPHIPYAPALAGQGIDLARLLWVEPRTGDERRWAFEQVLRSGVFRAAVAWSCDGDDERVFSRAGTRRLQLAAESSRTLGVLVRSNRTNADGSASVLRLALEHSPGGAVVTVEKCRGHRPTGRVILRAVDDGWQTAI